jgi:hypothetical protein
MKKRTLRRLPPAPRPGKKNFLSPSLIVALAVFLLLFIGNARFTPDDVTGNLVYQAYGYGGGFGFGYGYSFQDMYYTYGYLIDAVLFLVIFLSIGKIVFIKHFGQHAKPLYVGIGIFLAFALLLWEERNGIYLLEYAGPAGIVLLLMIIMLFFIRVLMALGMHAWLASLLVLLGVYFGVIQQVPMFEYAFDELLDYLGFRTDGGSYNVLILLVVFIVLLLIAQFLKQRWPDAGTTIQPPRSR